VQKGVDWALKKAESKAKMLAAQMVDMLDEMSDRQWAATLAVMWAV